MDWTVIDEQCLTMNASSYPASVTALALYNMTKKLNPTVVLCGGEKVMYKRYEDGLQVSCRERV
ncbi:hypothetical protein Fmac_032780 [Flemingia macrophylla]|uniref:Uncharacterized protein n=1 Tax=Flemingia macrophylla TaxID=520843 RepID=A0ABD1L5X1_9FABA